MITFHKEEKQISNSMNIYNEHHLRITCKVSKFYPIGHLHHYVSTQAR